MVCPEDQEKLYVKVPGRWLKYEKCCGLLVPISSVFVHASDVFLSPARAHHCVRSVMIFFQRARLSEERH